MRHRLLPGWTTTKLSSVSSLKSVAREKGVATLASTEPVASTWSTRSRCRPGATVSPGTASQRPVSSAWVRTTGLSSR